MTWLLRENWTTNLDRLLSLKTLLIAFSVMLLSGAALLVWSTLAKPPATAVVSQPSTLLLSAGPIAPKPDIQNPALENQNASKPTPKYREKHVITIQPGDSLSSVLRAKGVSNQQIYQLTQADHKGALKALQPGNTLEADIEYPNGTLITLTLSQNVREKEVFTAREKHFTHRTLERPITNAPVYKEVRIETSLFVDGSNEGISDKLLFQLAEIFKWDIDFALDIRPGDSFSILYEQQSIDGEAIGSGNILAAEFINNGRYFEAIRYDTEQRTDYFTGDGLSLRKAFIRSPVDFTRVSSRFNPNRLHPIFKTTRPHRGVDYAAAEGTPIQSSGDGTISYVGEIKGYGNTIIIDHGRGYTTLYGHLNSFAPDLVQGMKVEQGEEIGYVGQTGWATGPHLHYEFRVNGVHQNPETITIPNDNPMSKAELLSFLPYAQSIRKQLNAAHTAQFLETLGRLRR